MKTIEEMVNEIPMNRTVLITGGAGSLGKAFCRLLHKDYKVVVIDNSEWAVAELQKEMPDVEVHLMDFADWKFNEIPCEFVLHLAAYKHINLGEVSHTAFLENNVHKTQRLLEEAYQYNVNLMFMSTDKAVEPTSFYGYTKAMGEDMALAHNFAVARCGNILSSSGSVIPTWEKAIGEGTPIPLTDERMKRFFIEDHDAVLQIWDMFMGGEQLIIPKCEEIRLLDLLKMVLERHGKTIEDVTVDIIGTRGTEKLQEKLMWDDE